MLDNYICLIRGEAERYKFIPYTLELVLLILLMGVGEVFVVKENTCTLATLNHHPRQLPFFFAIRYFTGKNENLLPVFLTCKIFHLGCRTVVVVMMTGLSVVTMTVFEMVVSIGCNVMHKVTCP